MIISREIINKSIRYHDVIIDNMSIKKYDYSYLSSLIDAYKNLLLSKGAQPGHNALIGTPSSIEQVALVFACSELGIIISIVDFHPVDRKDVTILTERYKKILPIDFFILQIDNNTEKFKAHKDTCNKTIILNDEYAKLDYTPNKTILASDNSIFLKCVSFKNELIEHTHDFLSLLIERNSSMFYGNAGMVSNLNHGSSCATYFLPILVSNKVTDLYNIRNNKPDMSTLFNRLTTINVKLNHFMVPYTSFTDSLFDSNQSMTDCVIYTLGIIRKKWVTNFKSKVKDIISFFGTSETSGPFLINQATDIDFREDSYRKIDDFYNLELSEENKLEVSMPVYNRKFIGDDKFIIKNGKYVFYANPKVLRINEIIIDNSRFQSYTNYVNRFVKGSLVVDTFKNSMYLAIWEDNISSEHLNTINSFLKGDSEDKLYIEKYAVLNYNDFYSNNELNTIGLMEYFRNIGE